MQSEQLRTVGGTGALHQLVHKANPQACLISGWSPLQPPESYVLEIDWSSADSSFESGTDGLDVLLVAETVRQAGLLIPHIGFGVPRNWVYVMSSLEVEVFTELSGRAANNVGAQVECRDVIYRDSALQALTVNLRFSAEHRDVAIGVGKLRVLPPDIYLRLRSNSISPATFEAPTSATLQSFDGSSAQYFLREADADITDDLLGGDLNGGTELRVDTRHPVYFDHPSDHIPGMVAIEACRQLVARDEGIRSPARMTALFHRYLEYDPHPVLRLDSHGSDLVVNIYQGEDDILGPAATVTFADHHP